MGHILAFAMQKGGTGKTTTTLNLGVKLAERGAKVLLVDLDPQPNLTEGLGIDPTTPEYSTYEVLLNPELGTGFATIETSAGVDLIPASFSLDGAELELAGKIQRELLLRRALTKTRADYDYILLDPPPNLGLFTLNALGAADAVIVPLQTHVYAWRRMPKLEATVALMQALNPQLHIGGIVCTLVDRRTNLSLSVERQARAKYGDLVFQTVIPVNVRLAEAPAYGEPITIFAPGSAGAIAYSNLCEEVEVRYGR